MMKKITQLLLTLALTSSVAFALCQHETCSDSIDTLATPTLEAIARALANTDNANACMEKAPPTPRLHWHLIQAHCSAEAIHAVYTEFADQLTPDQAKYLFSRAPEASHFLDKLVFGLEYAKSTLEDMQDDSGALEDVYTALNKSKVTHCPHCYVNIIIPAIDHALDLLELHMSTLEDQHAVIY